MIFFFFSVVDGEVFCQEANRLPDDPTHLPMHRRMLEGADKIRDAQLEGLFRSALANEDIENAKKQVESLIEFRTAKQGQDHFQVRSALQMRRSVEVMQSLSDEAKQELKVANRKDNQFLQAFRRGQYDQAIEIGEQVLEIRERLLGLDHPDYQVSLSDLAVAYKLAANHEKAESLYLRASDLTRKFLGELHPEFFITQKNLAILYSSIGKYSEAEVLLEDALKLAENLYGMDGPDYARTLTDLATLHVRAGDYARATICYLQVKEIYDRQANFNNIDYAHNLNGLAIAHSALGEYTKAAEMHIQSGELFKRLLGEDHPTYATSLNNLAVVYLKLADFRNAELVNLRANRIKQQTLGDEHPDYLIGLNDLANIYINLGEYSKAEALYLKVCSVYEKRLDKVDGEHAKSLSNLAVLYHELGEYSKAETFSVKAIQLFRQSLGERHPEYAMKLHNLASLYDSMREHALAEKLYLESNELIKNYLGVEHPYYASSLSNLASHYSEVKDYLRAESLFLDSQALRKKTLGESHPEYIHGLASLASLYDAMGDIDRAESLYLEANAKYLRLFGSYHSYHLTTLKNLAGLYHKKRHYERAKQCLAECARGFEANRIIVASGFQRATAAQASNPYLSLVVAAAQLGNSQEAFIALERHSARSLLDVHSERRGLTLSNDQQVLRSSLMNALHSTEKQIESLAEITNLSDKQLQVLEEKIGARNQISRSLAELAGEVSVQEVCDVATIQESLAPDAALIAWVDVAFRGDVEEHWGCVLTARNPPTWFKLPGSGENGTWTKEDNSLVARLCDSLSQSVPSSNLADLTMQMRQQRIAVMLPFLTEQGISKLHVVGIEQMAGFPVEVIAPEFTVSYVPSGTYLSRLQSKPEFRSSLLAIGDPTYEVDGGRLVKSEWSDLPGTRVEVVKISELFQNSMVLVDSQASESAIDNLRKSNDLDRFDYMHFATHGRSDSVTAFESKLILSQDHPISEFTSGEPWVNNEVTAREVMDYWKLKADLVTLSACQTGLGRQGGGEGLLGFGQAFLLSGARSVCLSLWEVDDLATSLLMQRLYENLLGKRDGQLSPMPKAKALQEAKEWLRNLTIAEVNQAAANLPVDRTDELRGEKKFKRPDALPTASAVVDDSYKPYALPHYWAAFILIGAPD